MVKKMQSKLYDKKDILHIIRAQMKKEEGGRGGG